jgi:segregation and condensation protein A
LTSVQPYASSIVPDLAPDSSTGLAGAAMQDALSPINIALPQGLHGHDGVEILVDLAKRGDIDPWNLDLTAVADQYLETVQQLKASDLRITGKVLLYLAILLRMKSDILTHGAAFWLADTATDDYLATDDDPFAELPLPNVVSLETVLKRRTNIKQPRIRPVTLVDLITELQKIETLENRQAMKQALTKMERRRSQVDLANWTVDDIETMAHEEFVEDTLDTVSEAIDEVLRHGRQVAFHALVQDLHMDRITVFLALLFLAARTDITLHQPAFYGELLVQKPDACVESMPL